MKRKITEILSVLLCFLLIAEQSGFAQIVAQLDISSHLLQLHNVFVPDKFLPLHLRYLEFNPQQDGFRMLVDKGDAKNLADSAIEESTKELLKYFFIGLTLPNSSFWVNLRPDSPDNIIDDYLAQTDVGRILLEADLQLKKDTASFTSPQTPEGKQYWDKLYQKAGELFGQENITIPTLTRPWIVPGEIIVREAQDNAYIYKATLKVMLEQNYLKGSATYKFNDSRLKVLNDYSSQLIRELIIPKITKKVNTSKRYASLRQLYYSLIFAQWFKQKYSNQNNIYSNLIDRRDLAGLTSKTPYSKITYFQEYQKSFNNGEYKIKEPIYTPFGQTIRSYFSGGVSIAEAGPTGIILGQRQISATPFYTKRASARGSPATRLDVILQSDISFKGARALIQQISQALKRGTQESSIFDLIFNQLPSGLPIRAAAQELRALTNNKATYETDLRFLDTKYHLSEDEKQLVVFMINAGQGGSDKEKQPPAASAAAPPGPGEVADGAMAQALFGGYKNGVERDFFQFKDHAFILQKMLFDIKLRYFVRQFKNIRFKFRYPYRGINQISLDEILVEALRNAYDAICSWYDKRIVTGTPQGFQGKIKLKMEAIGNNLVITILDNGLGIYAANKGQKRGRTFLYFGKKGLGALLSMLALEDNGGEYILKPAYKDKSTPTGQEWTSLKISISMRSKPKKNGHADEAMNARKDQQPFNPSDAQGDGGDIGLSQGHPDFGGIASSAQRSQPAPAAVAAPSGLDGADALLDGGGIGLPQGPRSGAVEVRDAAGVQIEDLLIAPIDSSLPTRHNDSPLATRSSIGPWLGLEEFGDYLNRFKKGISMARKTIVSLGTGTNENELFILNRRFPDAKKIIGIDLVSNNIVQIAQGIIFAHPELIDKVQLYHTDIQAMPKIPSDSIALAVGLNFRLPGRSADEIDEVIRILEPGG